MSQKRKEAGEPSPCFHEEDKHEESKDSSHTDELYF